MAENIISPGVFTRENDLSFLPQGIGQIGAAIVGPTEKGPAFVPTVIRRGFAEYEARFGSYSKDTYVPLTVRNYLRNAGTVTVVRVLGGGGWKYADNGLVALRNMDGENADGTGVKRVLAVLHPSKNEADINLSESFIAAAGASQVLSASFNSPISGGAAFSSTFCLHLKGDDFTETQISMSLDPSSPNYITRAIGTDPDNSRSGSDTYVDYAFPKINFREYQTDTAITNIELIGLPAHEFTGSNNNGGYAEGYDHAATPYIESGYTAASGTTLPLFKVHKIADGTQTNTDCKISILNLREPGDLDGEEQYSTFSLQIRKFGDTDKSPSILEQYDRLNLNPDSPNYIARAIGDRYGEWNEDRQKVIIYGDYPTKSRYIRVEMDASIDNGAASPKLSPRGYDVVLDPIYSGSTSSPQAVLVPYVSKSDQTIANVYNRRAYLGWDFTKRDNDNFLTYLPKVAVANSTGKFNVDAHFGHASASWGGEATGSNRGSLSASVDQAGTAGPTSDQVKFSVPFQGGSDGMNPGTIKRTGEYITETNLHGLNLKIGQPGYNAYDKALDILSNQDEYDINMLAIPGVINKYHPAVVTQAVNFVEDRADCFYVMDVVGQDDKVTEAVSEAGGHDTNYAAAYYPWVKVLDPARNKPTFVPPSVVVPGAIAASDRIAAEWFAPAGLNRGVLGNVIEARTRLNQAERDALYEGKVNPIATFPRTGVCIWGQKTLQARPTALDRINVRRLLIEVKKFIASSSKYLVFEQNTLQTRNRFLGIANPYLESIQQRQGLYAFRVVMDESNNTPDEIDRNRLVGGIYLQPTRTAEYIILDFNILPTGATFDGGGGGGSY
jgi:hypothetical protein